MVSEDPHWRERKFHYITLQCPSVDKIIILPFQKISKGASRSLVPPPLVKAKFVAIFREIDDGQIDGEAVGQMGRKCDRWTYKPTHRQTDRVSDKRDGKTEGQTYGQRDGWKYR